MNTKLALKDTFIKMYYSKKIEDIKVKELCNLAYVSRGTFYIHYNDIYDLRNSIENELLSELEHKVITNENDINSIFNLDVKETAAYFFPVLEYISSKKFYFKSLLNETSDTYFQEKLVNLMGNNIRNLSIKEYDNNNNFTIYSHKYIISANIGVILHWIKYDDITSPCDIALLLSKFIHNGPLS